ncbi:MAG: hypothetical protein AB7F86_00915 [Bdellovibrionales bacterium]
MWSPRILAFVILMISPCAFGVGKKKLNFMPVPQKGARLPEEPKDLEKPETREILDEDSTLPHRVQELLLGPSKDPAASSRHFDPLEHGARTSRWQ